MKRILSVDDEPAMIDLVKLIFESRGYEVVGAFDSLEALDKLREEPFDLLTQDFMRFNIRGDEFLRIIRSDPELSDLPVILITMCTLKVRIQQTREAGVDIDLLQELDGYLQKPFSPADLLRIVEKVLAQGRKPGHLITLDE